MEPFYRTLEVACRAALRVNGDRLTVVGVENIPATGGAVVAINHTSYVDWMPAGLAMTSIRRRLRFMIKAEVGDIRAGAFVIRHTKLIPVDRSRGGQAYAEAVRELRAGELVAVYPEATISRSFELKEFKSGAARMALEANVPIVPMIVWGAHRIWTKGHPRRIGHRKIPLSVAVGPPLNPVGTVRELDDRLHDEMSALLDSVQRGYPHPAGAPWVPARLGGSAPTPEQARALDAAEAAERAARRQRQEGAQ
ncbi:lysophospholipid acyltransferase family protein [Mycolicibacterium brumae]|uniref:1-acyl-sn-glycerol-3-phosphate acyltransferase n=1 Tax=Mycolicibacterium brumae TaxID=85968 RepID=A0A2G5PE17_9MYCO|nr:lysophospholipid acyltransferase family protein [Mycolicibacterium brumae]MCV7191786.1 1-acyl-sn-glycerol-3-phosphate acyltransferase [Mycolicibacterium brumae]PIB76330.1 1-acyl-sn-glycerol-3-phosphate acyltransferase [Mycolicibacterium brumae]RWA15838.1 hypothetical protein MBRU_09825 [Mycolicibacterium brumae DSM 44177]UWW07092.1 1-acyl-sn-glycerol-3-phosphate acyltransferase [Mycolicibacterium brumae]